MSSSRRTYTAEFKQEAVLLVTRQGLSLAEAARRLGIHANLLRTWKQSFETNGPPAARVRNGEPELRLHITVARSVSRRAHS